MHVARALHYFNKTHLPIAIKTVKIRYESILNYLFICCFSCHDGTSRNNFAFYLAMITDKITINVSQAGEWNNVYIFILCSKLFPLLMDETTDLL